MTRTAPVSCDPRAVDSILAEFDRDGSPGAGAPGVAVGVAIDGEPVYRRAVGRADLESGTPLSTASRMRIASISKHFACLAFMLLCEDGAAGIDEPARAYLPDVRWGPRPPTMRELMGHTSGLRDAGDWFFYDKDAHVTAEQMLAFYREGEPAESAPGAAWRYNDGGYVLLGVAIERIAGRSLGDVLRERIFEPVGMRDTLLRPWDGELGPADAAAYTVLPGGGFERGLRFNEGGAQGGVVSTVDDMLLWMAHMDSPRVGSPATWEAMRTPQTLPNGTSSGFGLSLVSGRYRGTATLWHTGMLLGTTSMMLKLPDERLDVMVIGNRRDLIASELAYRIVDACHASLPPDSADVAAEPVTGIFRSASTGRVIQLRADAGQQRIATIDGTDRAVQPTREGTLRTTSHLRIEITPVDDPRTPSAIRFDYFGDTDTLVALDSTAPADARAIAGRYATRDGLIEAEIADGGSGPVLTLRSLFGTAEHALEPLGDGVWQARPTAPLDTGGTLSFDRDGAGFRLATLATPDLDFEPLEEHR